MASQKPHELYRTIPWRLYNLFTDEHREFWVTGSYNDSSKITPKPYIMVLAFVLVTHTVSIGLHIAALSQVMSKNEHLKCSSKTSCMIDRQTDTHTTISEIQTETKGTETKTSTFELGMHTFFFLLSTTGQFLSTFFHSSCKRI